MQGERCPTNFAAGFYWYGENLLADHQDDKTNKAAETSICEEEDDSTSEVDIQPEVETDTCSEEVGTP